MHIWRCLSATSSQETLPWTIFCIPFICCEEIIRCWIVIVGCFVVTCSNELKFLLLLWLFLVIFVIFDASQQCCMMMNSPHGALKAINLTCMRWTYRNNMKWKPISECAHKRECAHFQRKKKNPDQKFDLDDFEAIWLTNFWSFFLLFLFLRRVRYISREVCMGLCLCWCRWLIVVKCCLWHICVNATI